MCCARAMEQRLTHLSVDSAYVESNPPTTRIVVSKRFTSLRVCAGWNDVAIHSLASANSSFIPVRKHKKAT